MADDEHAQEELNEAAWEWAGRLVVAAVLIGAGSFGGYMKWGDAPELKAQVAKGKDEIVRLKNIRENMSTKIARCQRDKEVCERELLEAKKKAK